MEEEIPIPPILPAMVLPECNLMPHGMLPLFLFEARYREMVMECLERERIFFVAMRKDPSLDEISMDNVYPFATAGLVQSCRENEDGTFHLVLQGLQRIQILGLAQAEPFPKFHVRALPSEEVTATHRDLANRALSLTESLNGSMGPTLGKITERLRDLESPELTGDILAGHFLSTPLDQQKYLGMDTRSERLEYVVGQLKKVVGD